MLLSEFPNMRLYQTGNQRQPVRISPCESAIDTYLRTHSPCAITAKYSHIEFANIGNKSDI